MFLSIQCIVQLLHLGSCAQFQVQLIILVRVLRGERLFEIIPESIYLAYAYEFSSNADPRAATDRAWKPALS